MQVLSREEASEFARVCIDVAKRAADDTGFVPVRRLLERFRAQLFIRPLLVEGMVAPLPGTEGWAVLVDSETYDATNDDVHQERGERQLQERLRFTIAHELVHLLAFRPTEFGVELRDTINTDNAKSRVVDALEKLTDRLTPLLLVPEQEAVGFCKTTASPMARDFAHFRTHAGVSRMALINRFQALLHSHRGGPRDLDAIQNTALCVGQWEPDGVTAALRSWPVLLNFDRNVIPAFLHKLLRQDRLPAETIFPDRDFVLAGGRNSEAHLTVWAGTASVPEAERMSVHCSVEDTHRRPGSTFLFVVRKH